MLQVGLVGSPLLTLMLSMQGGALVRQLASYLDGCLGNALAALPDQSPEPQKF